MKFSTAKSWIKHILIFTGAVVFLILVLFAVALVVLDDDDYRKLAVWSVERFAGYRMIVEGPFEVDLSAEPSLMVGGIRFESIGGGLSPPLSSIGHFQFQMALKPLFWGTAVIRQLRIEDVSVDRVNIWEEDRDESWLNVLVPDIFMPVFESVTLKNIKLDAEDRLLDRVLRIYLKRLVIDDIQDRGPVYVDGDGLINETEFQIEGRLGALADILNRKQPYPLDINLQISDLTLTVSGTFADYADGEGMNLQISGEAQDLAKMLNMLKLDAPALGRLKFEAILSGDVASPRLSGLDLVVSDGSSLEFSAQGSIANLAGGEGTSISISGFCTNEAILTQIFPASWQIVENLKFKSTLRRRPAGFWFEEIDARVVNERGVILKAGGRLRLAAVNDPVPVKELDLNLHIVSTRTAALRPLLTGALPEIGSVDARGRLVGPIDRLALEDFVILRGGSGPVRMESRGRIGRISFKADRRLADMNFSFSGHAEQSKTVSAFYGVPIDEIGTVTITGKVVGASDRFQLKEIEFHSKDAQGLETNLAGGIDFATQADGKILGDVKFELEITAPNMGAAEPLLGANLVPGLGPVRAESLVAGTTDVLSFENIKIIAGKPEKVQVKWRGRVGQIPLGDDQPASEFETYGSLQAAKSSDFAALFGISVPDIGPVQASWRDVDRKGIYGIDQLKFIAGDGKTFLLSATGRVASIIRQKQVLPDGFDFQLSVRATNTDNLFKLIGMQLPNLGAVDGRLALSGGKDKLTAEGLHLTVKSSQGFEMVATGEVGTIGLEKPVPVRDIDVRLTAQAPDAAALPVLDNLNLPDLDRFQGSARIKDRDGVFNVETIKLRFGSENNAVLRMQGNINNVRSREHMKVQADFEVDASPWMEKLLQRTLSEQPKFNGSFKLANAPDHIRIETFNMNTADLGGLSVLAEGTAKAQAMPLEWDINIISNVKNPAVLGTSFDLSLPPLSPLTVDGQYSSDRQHRTFNGEFHLGKTLFQTEFSSMFKHPRPSANIKLSSKVVYMTDLGLFPEVPKNESISPSQTDPSTSASLFNDQPLPFDGLKSNDISLTFRADKVEGKNAALHRLGFKAELKNGRLRLDDFEVDYKNGHFSLESVLDTSGSEPTGSLQVFAEDVDIDDVLSYMHEPLVVEGQLNLAIDLQSRGRSSRELAANLSGEFGFAVENGKIQRGVEMIAADALDLLITSPSRKSFTNLNCMAGKLEFEEGVGTIDILYLDTPGVRARGGGSINLESEKIDLFVNPESKRRFFRRSSPIKVEGPLRSPAVRKVPAKEAAHLAAQVAVPLIALPGRALGYLISVMREDKDENSPCIQGMFRKN